MKKLIVLFLAIVCLLGLVGCHVADPDNSKQQTADTKETSTDTKETNTNTTETSTDTKETNTDTAETSTEMIEADIDIDPLIVSKIELFYCCNGSNSHIIEDAAECSDLVEFISKADGTLIGSSKGHYGAIFTLMIYFEGEEEPLDFTLWDDTKYSTSLYTDDDGYEYVFNADLSDMYQYLYEKYPTEFWYPELGTDK